MPDTQPLYVFFKTHSNIKMTLKVNVVNCYGAYNNWWNQAVENSVLIMLALNASQSNNLGARLVNRNYWRAILRIITTYSPQ